jgi:hypothetical protein
MSAVGCPQAVLLPNGNEPAQDCMSAVGCPPAVLLPNGNGPAQDCMSAVGCPQAALLPNGNGPAQDCMSAVGCPQAVLLSCCLMAMRQRNTACVRSPVLKLSWPIAIRQQDNKTA